MYIDMPYYYFWFIITIRNNCIFLYHDLDYLAHFGFDPVLTEVKGNLSVGGEWEQNQSQCLQKHNTKPEAPSCPNWREKKTPITFNRSRIGPKRTGLFLISFSFFRSFPPRPKYPLTPSLLSLPLFDLICNDLLHFFRAAAEWATFRKKKKYIYILKKKRELLDYTFDISANINQAEDFRLILSLIV